MPLAAWLAVCALGSLAAPTLVYALARRLRHGDAPRAARLAAWACLWVGQLAILLALVGLHCLQLALLWWARGAHGAAIVYGAVMTVVVGFVAVLALRTLALGVFVLARRMVTTIPRHAGALVRDGALALGVVALYIGLVPRWVPFPGREWTPVMYFALVLVPVGLTALLAVLMGLLLRRAPWAR